MIPFCIPAYFTTENIIILHFGYCSPAYLPSAQSYPQKLDGKRSDAVKPMYACYLLPLFSYKMTARNIPILPLKKRYPLMYLPPAKSSHQRRRPAKRCRCTKAGTVFSIQAEEAVMEGAEHWPRFSAVSSSLEEPLPELANMNESPRHQKQHRTKKTACYIRNSHKHKKTAKKAQRQDRWK